jgi:hypothetical protein
MAPPLVLVLLISACTAVRPVAWDYRLDASPLNEAPLAKSVGVQAVKDARPTSNVQNIVYMSPPSKFPKGTLNYSRPEEMKFFADAAYYVGNGGKQWAFRPAVDIRQAVVEELQRSGLFKEVRGENWGSGADYLLSIRLVATRYTALIQSYRASLLSLLQWMVFLFQRPGLMPSWGATNELELELGLTSSGSGAEVWHYRIRKQKEILGADMVFRKARSDFYFDELLKEGLREALADLARAMREVPKETSRTRLQCPGCELPAAADPCEWPDFAISPAT